MGIPVSEQAQGVLLLEKPDQSSGWFQVVKAAMTYTQLGLSVAAPLILSVLFAHWLQRKLDLGSWVSLLGLLVGLAAMILTLLRYIRGYIRESQKRQEKLKKKNGSAEE